MATTSQQKYLDAYNKIYGTSGVDKNGKVLDYSANSNYGSLSERDKNTLQNWYDSYLNEQSINNQQTESTLQAAKTNDLYMKYLNQMNAQSGLSGQGISDSTSNRLQRNYLNALNTINADTASQVQTNYQNTMTAQRENDESYNQQIKTQIDSLFNDGATKQQAIDTAKDMFGENSDDYNLAMDYINSHANWAETSGEYDEEGKITGDSKKWYNEYDNAPNNQPIARTAQEMDDFDWYIGEKFTDELGHEWKIVRAYMHNKDIDNYIDRSIKAVRTDGNITKGSDGNYYMASPGFYWVKVVPVD